MITIILTGSFVESVTPSSKLGGETAKAYLLYQKTDLNSNDLTSIIVMQKFIILLPFLFLCLFVILLSFYKYFLPDFVYIIYLITVLIFVIICAIYYKLGKRKDVFIFKFKKLNKVVSFISKSSKKSSDLLLNSQKYWLLLISLFIWLLYPLKLYLVSRMLGFNVEILFIILVTYIAYLAGIMPVSPGGLGTFEGTIALLFSWNGFYFAEGLSVALVLRLITYWFPLILSIIAASYLIIYKNIKIQTNGGFKN